MVCNWKKKNEVMQRIKRGHWLNGVMNASMFEAANCSGLGLLSFRAGVGLVE
jgi:hypothetical protein